MSGHPAPDVVCVGETMAVLTPADGRPLADADGLALGIGGAESNVACTVAALGHRAAWAGRVGRDPFGARILRELGARGVDTGAVTLDPDRPTGLYAKDPGPHGTRPHYYRRDSAAARMGPGLAGLPLLREARVLHVTGITAALSDSCAELLDALLIRRAAPGPLLSFDVNHRPALWRGQPRSAAPTLLALARAADLVFTGRDEAEALWGTAEPEEIRDLIAPAPLIVIKDAHIGATSYSTRDGAAFVPARRLSVVEPVGAGDAFAAGYLAALLEDRDPVARLRLGHLAAAAALRTRHDLPTLPPRDRLDPWLTLDDAAWSTDDDHP
ncbi:sugar kinase [Streptomyces sp. NPDC059853]|uniref:sugar kinase n=1 Tax=Streptomyces sp. NPDC059853 TaxID=3346973 RepID=UPI003666CF57